jgi:hypothetical protein
MLEDMSMKPNGLAWLGLVLSQEQWSLGCLGKTRLVRAAEGSHCRCMNTEHAKQLHDALASVRETVSSISLSGCDKDDLFELMDRVNAELSSPRPNEQTRGMFLNSIARSLRNEPKARDVCLRLEEAMNGSGVPSTWQSGV